MRSLIPFIVICAGGLAAPAALACGGGFGEDLVIEPDQKIAVVFRDGEETYLFNPRFCGKASEFGLILPVPAPLSGEPQLADAQIFDDLTTFTAPTIVYEDACYPSGGSGLGCGSRGVYGGDDGDGRGLDVIDAGQVGIFDWTLLHATSPAAFTDWLDASGYPYAPAAALHFSYYVNVDWYFVAFRVSADDAEPTEGYELCGDFGPIGLRFPAASPVIPARITATDTLGSSNKKWTVFAIAERQLRLVASSEFWDRLTFSGAVSQTDLATHARLADVALAGERITAIHVEFDSSDLENDILLEENPTQLDFRDTEVRTNWVVCECSGTGTHWVSTAVVMGALLFGLGRLRRGWKRLSKLRR